MKKDVIKQNFHTEQNCFLAEKALLALVPNIKHYSYLKIDEREFGYLGI